MTAAITYGKVLEKELKVTETRHLETSNTAARPCKSCGKVSHVKNNRKWCLGPL